MKPAVSLLAALLLNLTVPAPKPSALSPLVACLKGVGAEGSGNSEAAAAYRVLVKAGPEALIPLLDALNGAGPAAGHWLRSGIDRIAEQALQSGKALPVKQLEAFACEKRHESRTAFWPMGGWFARTRPPREGCCRGCWTIPVLNCAARPSPPS